MEVIVSTLFFKPIHIVSVSRNYKESFIQLENFH